MVFQNFKHISTGTSLLVQVCCKIVEMSLTVFLLLIIVLDFLNKQIYYTSFLKKVTLGDLLAHYTVIVFRME